MEQVFDFREFMMMLFKKFKLAIILGLVLAVLGGAFGFLRFPKEDMIKTSSSASISFVDKTQDATALNNATTNINAVITYDSFYIGILKQLEAELSSDDVAALFEGDKTPKIGDMKEIINVYMKGSVVYADVSCANEELSKNASKICIDYAIDQIPKFFKGIDPEYLQQQSINMTLQSNSTRMKDVIKFTIFGLGGGIVIAVLLIFFVDVLSLKVNEKSDLKKYGLPILGEINLNNTIAAKKGK